MMRSTPRPGGGAPPVAERISYGRMGNAVRTDRRGVHYAVSLVIVVGSMMSTVVLADREVELPFLIICGAVAALVLALHRREPEPRQATNVRVVVALLATGGLVLWDHMRPVSTWSAPAYWVPIIWVLILLAFAASAYRIDAFSLAFWDCSRFLAVVGLLGLGISYLSGTPFLSNLWNGLFRAQSLMPEPAALAPLVSAGVLLSWNRRRISWLVVFVLVGLGSLSPMVLLVLALSISLWMIADRTGLWGLVAVGLTAVSFSTLLAGALRNAAMSTLTWSDPRLTETPLLIPLNRLVSSYLQFTGESVGWQDSGRQASARLVREFLESQGVSRTGIGFGNDGVLADAFNMQPNALVPHFALAWGYLVAWGLVSLLCVGVLSRYRQADFPIFLTFLVTALLNSAGGWQCYGLVLLGAVAPHLARTVGSGTVPPSARQKAFETAPQNHSPRRTRNGSTTP